jgi:type I restriction enzyme S subunit
MANSWTLRTVAELVKEGKAEVRTGPFGTQLHASDYVKEGTPVINTRNIGFGDIRPEKLEFISEEVVNRLSSHLLQPADIVFGRKGAVERHAFISKKQSGWFQGSDCLRLRITSNCINPRFVSYFLLTEAHKQWIMNQASHGATMASLNQDIIGRISLPLPLRKTQDKIASILGTYDSVIDINTRRIKILEEMARLIYDEWFVKFRFPGHEKVKMVKSELGPIPEGWIAKKLGDVLQLEYGKALKADERTAGIVPVFGSSGIVGHHLEKLTGGPGIVVGRKGNVGSVFFCECDFWVIDTAYYVSTSMPLHYIYFNLRTQNFLNNDAAVPGLNRNQAHSLPIVVPDTNTLQRFESTVGPMFNMKVCLEKRNSNLRRTRDLLLPKLISGEIDVEKLDIKVPTENGKAVAATV